MSQGLLGFIVSSPKYDDKSANVAAFNPVFPRANTAITVSVGTGVTLRDFPSSPKAPYFSVAMVISPLEYIF